MFYYTYVLCSKVDHKFYIGWTLDMVNRLKTHNDGLVESTRDRRPFKLVYYEACLNKDMAIQREKTLKTGFGRKYLKQRIGSDVLPP